MTDTMISVERIMEMIPHRYPFLMIDKVKDIVLGESAVGIKNVTINEPFFVGHFPEKPVMPGVLIIEAMAQTSAVLVVNTMGEEAEGKLVYFMSIDDARFRKPVGPGDTLHIRVEKQQNRRNVWKFACVATVEGTKVAEASISAMIVD
ncbi:MAG: 3-hydroxyacyl-ACP dehydratase FabZ [Rickettsiales bacterium]